MEPFASRKAFLSRMAALCFFVGLAAGTVWANRLGTELQEQLGAYGQSFLGSGALPAVGAGDFLALLCRRWGEVGFGWLLGLTFLAGAALCLGAAGVGFSMAFLLSCMTVQHGLGGLPLFLASLFPQFLVYVPVGAILASWAASGGEKTHGAGFAVLLAAVFLGAAAELWLNPPILRAAAALLAAM